MAKDTKSTPASVHQRLLNKAKESSRSFNKILQYFAIERFIMVFHPSFMADEDKKTQWLGFTKKAKLTEAPASFEEVVAAVKVFLEPVVNSLADRRAFRSTWTAPGPWGE